MEKSFKHLLFSIICTSIVCCVFVKLTYNDKISNNTTVYEFCGGYESNNQKLETVLCIGDDTVRNEKSAEEEKALMKERKKDSIRKELLKGVRSYVKLQAPKAHTSIPYYLVEHSLRYDIDISFMMAQTQLETNFGTLGIGRQTSKHSLFGVCGRYSNYEDAVDSYCKLLKRSYLVNGKTEVHLMNNYINHRGARYAKSTKYEKDLKTNHKYITKNTNVQNLQNEYRKIDK